MSVYYLLHVCLLVLFSLPGAVNHSSLYLTFSTETGRFHILLTFRTVLKASAPGHLSRHINEADGLCFSFWVSVSDRNAVRGPV